ncbi:MAG: tRNA(fMet)-specific endonuclease VapC [Candidatus Nanohaloarchaea archaeon]
MILDTSVLIDILKGEDEMKKVEREIDREGSVFITPITIMELWEGIHRSDHTDREREKVSELLSSLNTIGFNTESSKKAGKISADLLSKGKPVDVEDIMIGAIALQNNEKVLTGNGSHFDRIEGLKVEEY